MQFKLKILGIFSIITGAAASALCFYPSIHAMQIAMPISFIGMISSTAYVFIDMKHQITNSKITLGIIGILLSSIPVLLILGMILMNRTH